MNKNLTNALSTYCDSEIEDLKKTELFEKLQNIVYHLHYSLVCDYSKVLGDNKCEHLYLCITIFDDKNEMIEIFDEGWLSIATLLVSVDKKCRYQFFSWKDDELIEDINWIITQLEKIKSNSYK